MYKVLNNLDEINWYRGPILESNPHEKRSASGNQHGFVREHFPSKLRNDFSPLNALIKFDVKTFNL